MTDQPPLDVPLNSPAIKRLLQEIAADDAAGIPRSYNRTYSRHNRSMPVPVRPPPAEES